ncbi:hypothetical protein CKJ80_00495 [Corynebacterium hadale]|uniref:Uncharacterized protein n=1 Tax=Corynebacterium hadale TaxID=2026255 RepID=A0AB36RMQ3_9CORY|nr:hypothetical protein CKJ80_00495 [Corynebacterium hadale]
MRRVPDQHDLGVVVARERFRQLVDGQVLHRVLRAGEQQGGDRVVPLPEGRVQLVERLGSGLGFWAGGDGEPGGVAVVKRDGPEAGASAPGLEPGVKRYPFGDCAPRVVAGVGHGGVGEAAGPHRAADPVRAHHNVEALFAAVGEGDRAGLLIDAYRPRRGSDARTWDTCKEERVECGAVERERGTRDLRGDAGEPISPWVTDPALQWRLLLLQRAEICAYT